MAPQFETAGAYSQTSGGNPATSIDVAVPSGVAVDDIIAMHLYVDSITITSTPPAGFNTPGDAPVVMPGGGPATTLRTYWKRATAADTGVYTVTFSSSVFAEAAAVRVSGCATSGDPFEATNPNTNTSSSTSTPAVSVTTLGANRLLVHAATDWAGGTWTASTGFTTRASGGFGTLHVATAAQASAGSSGAVSATSTASDRTMAWLGALKGPDVSTWTYGYDVRIG